ncbi:MAG: GIY-YIG nuclease family protein, partial [Plesiomonas sp.]
MSSSEYSLSPLTDCPYSPAGAGSRVEARPVASETIPAESTWWLYMVRMADGRLYTGISTDVARRFTQHSRGKGARALR